MTAVQYLDRIADRAARISGILAGAMLIAMMVLIAGLVALRNIVGWSFGVSEEYSGYLLIGVTIFGAAYSLASGSLIRVGVLFDRMSAATQSFFTVVFDALSLAFVVLLGYYGVAMVKTSFMMGSVSMQQSRTPLFIPQLVLVVGLVPLGLVLLASMVRALGALWSRTGNRHS